MFVNFELTCACSVLAVLTDDDKAQIPKLDKITKNKDLTVLEFLYVNDKLSHGLRVYYISKILFQIGEELVFVPGAESSDVVVDMVLNKHTQVRRLKILYYLYRLKEKI